MGKPPGYVPSATDLAYVDDLHGRQPAALAELEEHGQRDGIPIVDRATGRALAVLAAGRRRILEIGTAYGYSTLWMALAMAPDGRLTTIDPDRARTDIARGYWRRAGVPDERISVVNRPALEALRGGHDRDEGSGESGDEGRGESGDEGRGGHDRDEGRGESGDSGDDGALKGPFELVFIDALKEEYIAYLEAVLPRCEPGSLITADNVLWGGHVAGAPSPAAGSRPAAATEALRAFNKYALAHPRLNATILPIGDGLLLASVRP
jgi:caffeoyl-CoA O-methyltransferase